MRSPLAMKGLKNEVYSRCKNYTILTSQEKARRIIMRSAAPICSISGGSDSDIVLDGTTR